MITLPYNFPNWYYYFYFQTATFINIQLNFIFRTNKNQKQCLRSKKCITSRNQWTNLNWAPKGATKVEWIRVLKLKEGTNHLTPNRVISPSNLNNIISLNLLRKLWKFGKIWENCQMYTKIMKLSIKPYCKMF